MAEWVQAPQSHPHAASYVKPPILFYAEAVQFAIHLFTWEVNVFHPRFSRLLNHFFQDFQIFQNSTCF